MDCDYDELEFLVDWADSNKRQNIANNLITEYRINDKIQSSQLSRFAILHHALTSEVDRIEQVIDYYFKA